MVVIKFLAAIGLLALAGGFGVFLGWMEEKMEGEDGKIR